MSENKVVSNLLNNYTQRKNSLITLDKSFVLCYYIYSKIIGGRYEENFISSFMCSNGVWNINSFCKWWEREADLAAATDLVEKAEAINPIAAINEAQDLLNKATKAVEALGGSEEKTALEGKVKAQQELIDAIFQRLKDNAEYHVSRFEANPTDEILKTNAQLAIRALPENERAPYQTRYNKVTTEAIEEVTRKTFYTFQIGNEFYTYGNANGNVTRYLMDVKPYILNDRTMLPMRYTAYTLGLQVAYDDTTRVATFFDRDTVVTINIDSNEVKLNGSVVRLDAPVQNVSDRLMTPVSQIARLFGRTNGDWNDGIVQDIEWVNQHRLVFIFD